MNGEVNELSVAGSTEGNTLRDHRAFFGTRIEFPEPFSAAIRVKRKDTTGLLSTDYDRTSARKRVEHDGLDIDVPFFNLSGTRVWGAAAMILSEFLHLLGYEPDPW